MAIWNERIKQKRLERGITLAQAAEFLNVTEATAQRYESGSIKNIPYEQICLYAQLLKTSPAYIMGWENSDSVSSLINNRINELDISLEQVSEATGVSLHWLQNIDSFIPGEFGNVETGYEWITRVAEYIGLPGSELRAALARQEIPVPDNQSKISAEEAFGGNNLYTSKRENIKNKKGIEIPVLGRVAAGIPITATEHIIDTEEISQAMAADGDYFALQIRGDSMEPKISNGDVVIVRKQSDADDGDLVIALVNGDDAVCKRLKKYKEGIALLSNNPAYEPMYFSRKDITEKPVSIIGKVKELRAKF